MSCLVLWCLWLVCFADLLTSVPSCGIVVWVVCVCVCVSVGAYLFVWVCSVFDCLPLAGCACGGLRLVFVGLLLGFGWVWLLPVVGWRFGFGFGLCLALVLVSCWFGMLTDYFGV